MTIALIVPVVEKYNEEKTRRMLEAIKKGRGHYLINLCFVGGANDVIKFSQSCDILGEYKDTDLTISFISSDKFGLEDKVKEAIASMDDDYYCVMDQNIVMFETFFERLVAGFRDEGHDVGMVCPRFTVGEKAFDGGVYFEPGRKCFMIEKRNRSEILCKTLFDYMNDNATKILRNCVCHRYGTDKLTLRKDDLSCDLYI